jgi:S1-C subfamily serine protease
MRSLLLGFLLLTSCSSVPSTNEWYAGGEKSIFYVTNKAFQGHGTGFTVFNPYDHKKYILTNNHVCEGLQEADGAIYIYSEGRLKKSKVLYKDPSLDLCLIYPRHKSPPFYLHENNMRPDHQNIFIMGYGADAPLTLTIGHRQYRTKIQLDGGDTEFEAEITTAVIYPGNSGSPVFDSNMEVIGVVFAGSTITHYGAFIPLDKVYLFLEEYFEYRKAGSK